MAKQISFGDFFGNNLDAFRDYISILFGSSIKFNGLSYLNKEMKMYIERVISIIMEINNDYQELGNDFQIKIEISV